MSKSQDYIIPTKLSDYVETLTDSELVEYASRFHVTSKYCINGATQAFMDEVLRVWRDRYRDETIPILECYPPLSSFSTKDLSTLIAGDKSEKK